MTDKEAIRLIREAGFAKYFAEENLTQFKNLIETVTKIERDACWDVCDKLTMYGLVAEAQQRYNQAYWHCKDAIRNRDKNDD